MLQTGYSTTVHFGASGVLQARSVDHSGADGADIDLGYLNSPDRTAESRRGAIDPGAISVDCLFDSATHKYFFDRVGGALDLVRVTFPDGSKFESSGFISNANIDIGGESDPITASFEFTLSGPPTVTLAS